MKYPPFLRQIADHFFTRHADDLYKYRFYFQNRRAGVFFLHYLEKSAADAKKTIFLPEVTTLQEELYLRAGVDRPDINSDIFLVYEMYGIIEEEKNKNDDRHKFWERLQSGQFSDFYQLGQTILSDFNDIDNQLADAKAIYKNAEEQLEIDRQFQRKLSEGEIKVLELLLGKRFSSERFADGDMEVARTFVSLFSLLSDLYEKTRERLREKGLFYPGMLIRQAVEGEGDDAFVPDDQKTHVIIGLNALSKAERRLLRIYKERVHTLFYWDYQSPIFDSGEDSIGLLKLKRENLRDFPMPDELSEDYIEFAKISGFPEAEVVAIPSKVAQTVFMTDNRLLPLLKNTTPDASLYDPDLKQKIEYLEVAVVLPNERLLMPLLSNLPGEIQEINVTMGYPLRETPLSGMVLRIMSLFRLVRSRYKASKDDSYYLVSEVLEILSMKSFEPLFEGTNILSEISNVFEREHLFFLSSGDLERLWRKIEDEHQGDDTVLEALGYARSIIIFPPLETSRTKSGLWLLDYFTSIIKELYERSKDVSLPLEKGEDDLPPAFTSPAVHYLFVLNLLDQKIRPLFGADGVGKLAIDLKIMSDLLKGLFQNARIPYEGEPLKGLQVLGILETRSLDFDTLFIPDASEGVLPAHTQQNTLIPLSIRVGNDLPTYKWQEITRAYNFFRLISRASKIYTSFDSRKNENSDGEPSRYLRLMEYDVYGMNPSRKTVRRGTASYIVQASDKALARIEISPEMVRTYRAAVTTAMPEGSNLGHTQYGEPEVKKGGSISASALNTFITCPLLFYYKYIERRRDEDPSTGLLEEREKGNILHKTLKALYDDHDNCGKGEPLDADRIKELLDDANPKLRSKIDEIFGQDFGNMSRMGLNANELDAVEDLVRRVIRYDAQNYNGWIYVGGEVHFSGRIRIPKSGGQPPEAGDTAGGVSFAVNIVGDIDRILYHPEKKILRLFDFKTGRDKNSTTVASLSSDKRNFEHVVSQLSFYSLVAGSYIRHAYGQTGDLFAELHLDTDLIFPPETAVEAYMFKPIDSVPVPIAWGSGNDVKDFMRQSIKPAKGQEINLLEWFSKEVVRDNISEILDINQTFAPRNNASCRFCMFRYICPESRKSSSEDSSDTE